MRWMLVLAAAGGCMTDPNGDTCAWVPGSDGFCPSDTGGGGSAPSYHRDGEAVGTAIGGGVQVVMAGRDDGALESQLETATVVAGVASDVTDVTAEGGPIAGDQPRAAAIGDAVYIAWRDQAGNGRGAPMTGLASVGAVADLGGPVRWLLAGDPEVVAVHDVDGSGAITAAWVDGSGAVTLRATLVSGAAAVYGASAGDGELALDWSVPTADGHAIMVGRFDDTGAPLDGDGIELAQGNLVYGGDLAVTGDGGVIAYYSPGDGSVHAARLDPDGTLTDQVTQSSWSPSLVTTGDQLIGYWLDDTLEIDSDTLVVESLDPRGNVLDGPHYPAELEYDRTVNAAATPTGVSFVEWGGAVDVLAVARDLGADRPVEIATPQPVGGCNAGGASSGGGALVLLLCAQLRRRARVLVA